MLVQQSLHVRHSHQRNPSTRRQPSVHTREMQQLLDTVKITPAKDKHHLHHVNNIRQSLEALSQYSQVQDELKTIELLLDSLQKKITNTDMLSKSTFSQAKTERSTLRAVSPIKQFQEISSPIVYSNFSIKNIPISQAQTPSMPQTPRKNKQDQQNQEIDRLNGELKMLEQILKKNSLKERQNSRKALGVLNFNTEQVSSKKKYMQSENLCPPYRNQNQSKQIHRLSSKKAHLR